jgi:hypothetical protein
MEFYKKLLKVFCLFLFNGLVIYLPISLVGGGANPFGWPEDVTKGYALLWLTFNALCAFWLFLSDFFEDWVFNNKQNLIMELFKRTIKALFIFLGMGALLYLPFMVWGANYNPFAWPYEARIAYCIFWVMITFILGVAAAAARYLE